MKKKSRRLKFAKKTLPTPNITIKDIPTENSKLKHPSFFKKKLNHFKLILFIVSLVALIYFLVRIDSKSFSCLLYLDKKISFQIAKETKSFSSPLCGCLMDDVRRYGILFTGNDITLERKGGSNHTNYLITAPGPGNPYSIETYGLQGRFYSVSEPKDLQTKMDIDDILTRKNKVDERKMDFKHRSFFSIITNSELLCRSLGNLNTFSLLPSEESKCSISLFEDKYEHSLSNIELQQELTCSDEYRSPPRLDILGDSIVFIWRGKPKILTGLGVYPFIKENYPDSLDFINVLIVKSPFATRVGILGWNDDLENSWKADYAAQFANKKVIWYQEAMPIAIVKDSGMELIDPLTVIPPSIPNIGSCDNGIFKLSVNKLSTENAHANLYQYFSEKEGIWVNFDSLDYSIADSIVVSLPDSIADKLSLAEKRIMDDSISAHRMQDISEFERSLITMENADTFFHQRMELKGKRAYFRYPPISFSNSMLIFNDVTYLKLDNPRGRITIEGKEIILDGNSSLEFNEMNNCKLEHMLSFGISNMDELVMKGESVVKKDGVRVGRAYYELEWYLILSASIFIISIIILIKDLAPLFILQKR